MRWSLPSDLAVPPVPRRGCPRALVAPRAIPCHSLASVPHRVRGPAREEMRAVPTTSQAESLSTWCGSTRAHASPAFDVTEERARPRRPGLTARASVLISLYKSSLLEAWGLHARVLVFFHNAAGDCSGRRLAWLLRTSNRSPWSGTPAGPPRLELTNQ